MITKEKKKKKKQGLMRDWNNNYTIKITQTVFRHWRGEIRRSILILCGERMEERSKHGMSPFSMIGSNISSPFKVRSLMPRGTSYISVVPLAPKEP